VRLCFHLSFKKNQPSCHTEFLAKTFGHVSSNLVMLGNPFSKRCHQWLLLFVAVACCAYVFSGTEFLTTSIHAFGARSVVALDRTTPSTWCITPLFVGVLNDVSGMEALAAAVEAHNRNVAIRNADKRCTDVPCGVQLHVLDNIGCNDFRALERHTRHGAAYFDAQAHLRGGSGSGALLHSNDTSRNVTICEEWAALVSRLTDPHDKSRSIPVRVSRGLVGTHTFGQSMNWFLMEARRTYQQDVFFWAHTDVVVADPTIFADLLEGASRLIQTQEPFSYLLTAYDALCVVHASAIMSTVGLFDEFMWYYGEVDLMLRAELAGLPMFQWDHGDKVVHHSMSSMRRGGESSRFQRSVKSRMELWRLYYNTRWEQEFHIRIEKFLVTYLHFKFSCDDRRELPLRHFVDAMGAYLKSPARLTIRGANFQRQNGCERLRPEPLNPRDDVQSNHTQLVSNVVVYFLPVSAFDRWYDGLAKLWEERRTEYVAFLRAFGLDRVEFFQQQFDKK
jgi:hypothetical protein